MNTPKPAAALIATWASLSPLSAATAYRTVLASTSVATMLWLFSIATGIGAAVAGVVGLYRLVSHADRAAGAVPAPAPPRVTGNSVQL